MALTGVPPEGVEAALAAVGWTLLRAADTGYDDSYELFATRGLAGLWLRLPGVAPDFDGWMANRQLVFARGRARPRCAAAGRGGRVHVGLPRAGVGTAWAG